MAKFDRTQNQNPYKEKRVCSVSPTGQTPKRIVTHNVPKGAESCKFKPLG